MGEVIFVVSDVRDEIEPFDNCLQHVSDVLHWKAS